MIKKDSFSRTLLLSIIDRSILKQQVSDIIDGGAEDTEKIEEVLGSLNNITSDSSEEGAMEAGDLNATLSVLDDIATARSEVDAEVSKEEVKVSPMI